MYRRVLLAYDGSLEGRTALREGALLARNLGAQVFLLAVVAHSKSLETAAGMTGVVIDMQPRYKELFDEGVARLAELGFRPNAKLVVGEPAEQIAAYAREISADLVVVGHRRQGIFARWWSGSSGAYLSDYLQCSLLIGKTEISIEAFEREIGPAEDTAAN